MDGISLVVYPYVPSWYTFFYSGFEKKNRISVYHYHLDIFLLCITCKKKCMDNFQIKNIENQKWIERMKGLMKKVSRWWKETFNKVYELNSRFLKTNETFFFQNFSQGTLRYRTTFHQLIRLILEVSECFSEMVSE